MGRADVYVQPDAPDPVLPADLVVELARPHLPGNAPIRSRMTVDESGGEARAYLFGDGPDGPAASTSRAPGVVVKTQRPHRLRPRTSLAKEAAMLRALAGSPVAGRIPALYGYDRVDTDAGPVEFIVMSRIPGRAARSRDLPAAARENLLGQLAQVLRVVHDLDAAAFPRGTLPTVAGAGGLRARLEPNFADLVERFAERPATWPLPLPAREVARRALDALPATPTGPVPLHSNPGPTHAFCDERGTFTGLIDFGDAYAAHPALDLRSWPEPDDRRILRERYLDGRTPDAAWDAVWTTAMVYADMAALAGPAGLAARAAAALTERLRHL